MEQKCEICGGEIRYGFCQSCGLLGEDYYPAEEDIDEEEVDEQEGEEEDTLQIN